MGVAGANMQWCHFAPVKSKEESTAFYETLGDFRIPVSKLVEVVLHVGKGAKFGGEKVNGGKVYAAETPVLKMGEILLNPLSGY